VRRREVENRCGRLVPELNKAPQQRSAFDYSISLILTADLRNRVAGAESGVEVRQTILPYSDEWKWAQEIAPAYELDGRSMAEFLQWISRESGFLIEYETESAKSLAEETILHGKIDLPPMKALEIMFQTADLAYELQGGVIVVSTRQTTRAFGS